MTIAREIERESVEFQDYRQAGTVGTHGMQSKHCNATEAYCQNTQGYSNEPKWLLLWKKTPCATVWGPELTIKQCKQWREGAKEGASAWASKQDQKEKESGNDQETSVSRQKWLHSVDSYMAGGRVTVLWEIIMLSELNEFGARSWCSLFPFLSPLLLLGQGLFSDRILHGLCSDFKKSDLHTVLPYNTNIQHKYTTQTPGWVMRHDALLSRTGLFSYNAAVWFTPQRFAHDDYNYNYSYNFITQRCWSVEYDRSESVD